MLKIIFKRLGPWSWIRKAKIERVLKSLCKFLGKAWTQKRRNWSSLASRHRVQRKIHHGQKVRRSSSQPEKKSNESKFHNFQTTIFNNESGLNFSKMKKLHFNCKALSLYRPFFHREIFRFVSKSVSKNTYFVIFTKKIVYLCLSNIF